MQVGVERGSVGGSGLGSKRRFTDAKTAMNYFDLRKGVGYDDGDGDGDGSGGGVGSREKLRLRFRGYAPPKFPLHEKTDPRRPFLASMPRLISRIYYIVRREGVRGSNDAK